MKIGKENINEAFFKDWEYDKFVEFVNSSNLKKGTGLSVDKLAKRLGIVIPKKKETDVPE